jgi:hypothetical protein
VSRLKSVIFIAFGFTIALLAVMSGLAIWGKVIVSAAEASPWLALVAIVVPLSIIFALIITSEDLNDPM